MDYLASNIFLNTLFSSTFKICSSFKMRDQASQPYNTTGNIIDLYVLTFNFFSKAGGKTKCSQVNNNTHFPYLF